VKRLLTIKNGAIVGAQVAQKYGWKSGDLVPLLTLTPQKDGNRTWTFEVVGTYEYPEEPDMANLIIINNDYFEQARRTLIPNTVARIVVDMDGVAAAAAAAEHIDEMFANSAVETVTISENESAQARLESLGDLNFVTRAVTAVAFIALLLSVGTMMMHSVRERTAEIGVLKALGFSNERVGGLLLAEALVVSITGSAAGLAIATRVLPLARQYAGLVEMPTAVVIAGIGIAIVLAAAFAWLPARYALRLRVVQALGRR
jgi:putative ABC transport system permease protein